MPLARHDRCHKMTRWGTQVSTHMPLARHDKDWQDIRINRNVSTHMPLARHDIRSGLNVMVTKVSTHMPLARHDDIRSPTRSPRRRFLLTCLLRGMTSRTEIHSAEIAVSTHMPLARHDFLFFHTFLNLRVSTHMPLARHDPTRYRYRQYTLSFYSHASCEA